jgi:hypothetical protein
MSLPVEPEMGRAGTGGRFQKSLNAPALLFDLRVCCAPPLYLSARAWTCARGCDGRASQMGSHEDLGSPVSVSPHFSRSAFASSVRPAVLSRVYRLHAVTSAALSGAALLNFPPREPRDAAR